MEAESLGADQNKNLHTQEPIRKFTASLNKDSSL